MKNRLAQKKRCPEEGLFQPPCRGGAFQPETSPIHLSGLKRLITNILLGFLKDETCFGKLFGGVGPTEKLTGADGAGSLAAVFTGYACLNENGQK